MGSTQPMWVGLDLCDGLGWVEFFSTHHGRLDQKISLTRPMHTPTNRALVFFNGMTYKSLVLHLNRIDFFYYY